MQQKRFRSQITALRRFPFFFSYEFKVVEIVLALAKGVVEMLRDLIYYIFLY